MRFLFFCFLSTFFFWWDQSNDLVVLTVTTKAIGAFHDRHAFFKLPFILSFAWTAFIMICTR